MVFELGPFLSLGMEVRIAYIQPFQTLPIVWLWTELYGICSCCIALLCAFCHYCTHFYILTAF
ncbi:hypothetical protein HanRHA438_Chr09g0407821 [Helianthus annuus]|nr:hypothetical protein HanXRQr2_Chr09g0395971 [Helianthus annuus]KAJ0526597.1 hypothetical protein HanHA300_Chr09g0324951 [Helianthus annuus]KAJ0542990.1 hypothetical protein HanHA89_Chr09g0345861 [Helianthus annuus]KAJ0708044.1 hypothetical protein HanLR1_Chr09g0325181 [Helianthus annuus]KAJ0888967.1 hypothetical protein HanRHA438_Chr09g0407821 [Helianthus annuus]